MIQICISRILQMLRCFWLFSHAPQAEKLLADVGKNRFSSSLPVTYFCFCVALRLVTECFCGYDFKSEAKVDDGECDYACAGKSSVACGGKNRVSVFKFDEGTHDKHKNDETKKNTKYEKKREGGNNHGDKKDEDKAEVAKSQPGNMLGCFKDTRFKRVLNLTRDYKLDKMTPEVRTGPLVVVVVIVVVVLGACVFVCLSVGWFACLFRISLFQCISVPDVCMLCLSYPVLGHDIALSNALRCIISVS